MNAFLKYILLIMVLQLFHFSSPLYPPLPCTSLPAAFSPRLVHVHGSYIKVLWLLHFLYYFNLPLSFCTYQLCFLFPVPFPPFFPFPLLTVNPPCNLHFCDSVPVLGVCSGVCLFFFLRFS